jgi:DNA helicase II / ATP-dependent DNA helicase PcrA
VGILFRANSQARVIEQALRIASIPYRVVGGMTFFDRKEVKDTLAYLRFMVNPQDELALRRVLAFPQRGVGEGTIGRLLTHARSKGCSAGDLLKRGDLPSGLHRRAENAFLELRKVIGLRDLVEGGTDPVGGLVQALDIVKFRSGLWEASKTRDEGEKRWDNVEEVLTAFKRFVEKRQGTVTASDFLQDLALSQQDDKEKENDTPVILMSLHASKGLEFPIVFLPGVEENLLPHWRSVESGDISEERRLFYVGITRAKEELYLSGCRIRRQYKKSTQCKASRFLDELPEGITEAGLKAATWSEEDAHKAAMDQLANLFGSDE